MPTPSLPSLIRKELCRHIVSCLSVDLQELIRVRGAQGRSVCRLPRIATIWANVLFGRFRGRRYGEVHTADGRRIRQPASL